MQSLNVDGPKSTLPILESGLKNEKEDFQVTLNFQGNEKTEIIKIIQALADKLISLNVAEWHKIKLKDGRKGFALFFCDSDWELVDNELIEIKKNN